MIKDFNDFIKDNNSEGLNENEMTISDRFWDEFRKLCEKYHLKDFTIGRMARVLSEVLNDPDYM